MGASEDSPPVQSVEKEARESVTGDGVRKIQHVEVDVLIVARDRVTVLHDLHHIILQVVVPTLAVGHDHAHHFQIDLGQRPV
ncbi:hypothetical protein JF66_03985 [Cryobacterium sp. MLB-32]|nr:hypothetical protein JF66_03985 [Cryobacterium sp. MLB-32]